MMKENPHWVADPVGSVKDSLNFVIINIDLKFNSQAVLYIVLENLINIVISDQPVSISG